MREWLSDDWIRYIYYGRITELLQSLEWPETVGILEWAECKGIVPQIIAEVANVELTLAPYPEYDIQRYYGSWIAQFDVVVADQVLEHVPNFFVAVANCIDCTKRGGVVVFGSPWIYPYHAAPKDYWRISRDGYKWLFETYGIETIEIGGWGHQKALVHGNLNDSFLSAFRCKCGKRIRDPHSPCPNCGSTDWDKNRTVEEARQYSLLKETADPDHAIEIWSIGRKR